MKWTKKGHEYDAMYREIIKHKQFYLFGAGDYGRQFHKAFRDELDIIGFIDNDKRLHDTFINSLKCYSFDDAAQQIALSPQINATPQSNTGIILTMSQINRVFPMEQLAEAGYKRNVDYFIIDEFISVYNVYKHDLVYFSSISFLPSTVCNLKCRYCLNFNPFADTFYVRKLSDLISDVDLFFSCVDHIMLFHVSGGEPLLYKHIVDIIKYIDDNYRDRIGTLRTVTNGTVVPSKETLERLAECNIEITVDDYREAVPQYNSKFGELLRKFDEYGINHYVNKPDSWINLAPDETDNSSFSESELIQHRKECNQGWQELRDGKLYNCNYAAYAVVAGIAGDEDEEEVFDLRDFQPERKKELVEFRLGYSTKGYTNFCKKCRGFTKYNTQKVGTAVQV